MSELNMKEMSVEELGEVAGGYTKPREKTGYFIYQIQKGDSLISIAKKFGISDYKKIVEWNSDLIKNPSLIVDGWKLRLYY